MTGVPRRHETTGHYATDASDGGPYRPAGAFNYDAHDRWVQAGHCPVVSWTKAWCSLAPHGLAQPRHMSPRDTPGGRETQWWDR